MGADKARAVRGALAGAAAAAVWAAQQPLDKRIFGVDQDDVDLLGALATGDRRAPATVPIGVAWHVANGALFGAAYSAVAPSLRGPGALRGLAAGVAEGVATWPLTRFVGLMPAGSQFPTLWGDRRAFAQTLWRHALFGAVLGAVERRLNPPPEEAPPADETHASTNGHGSVEHLVVARTA